MPVIIEGGCTAKCIRPKQLEQKRVTRKFGNEMVDVCSRRFLLIRKANQGRLIRSRSSELAPQQLGQQCECRLVAQFRSRCTGVIWPLQDSLLLLVVCARINRPFILPARLHCPHCFNTIARLLGNIRLPLDLPFVQHAPYNIGNGNIV